MDLSAAQDVEAGDGTTSVVVIAGALLGAAEKLLAKGNKKIELVLGITPHLTESLRNTPHNHRRVLPEGCKEGSGDPYGDVDPSKTYGPTVASSSR